MAAAQSGTAEGEAFGAVLRLRGYRYFWLAVAQVVVAIAVYVTYQPTGGVRAGDTWAGYGLGIWSAGLVVWLAWYGIRKRRYGGVLPKPSETSSARRSRGRRAPLKVWLSAHVYFGLALLVISALHAGFRFGWSLHTLVFVVMALVIASGAVGIFVVSILPERTARNMRVDGKGVSADELLERIENTEKLLQGNALPLGDEIVRTVEDGLEEKAIRPTLWDQFRGAFEACPARRLAQKVRGLGKKEPDQDALRLVIDLLDQRSRYIDQLRLDRQYRATLTAWLLVHLPLTVGLLVLLVMHVYVVLLL
jgi:hypothetical protein